MGAEQSCCQSAGPSYAPEVVQAQNVQPVQFSKTKCLAGPPCTPASENDDEQNLQTAQSFSERTPTVLIAESNGSSSRQVPAVPAGSSFGIEKIEKMNHLEVDQDILRGIALHHILREWQLWKSPEAVRQGNRAEKVWALSRKVAAIDTFISHSWRTKGRWKVLSLLMQSGWPHAFVGWFLGVAIALPLTATGVLDLPLEATINVAGTLQTVTFGPWTLIFGCVMMLVGFLASPFLPCQDRLCFLDVACIHQGDTELLERGIYGIGGFLSVSTELRVLYSRPYLSSLWCVFELVAFYKANPNGRVTFSPVWIERSVMFLNLVVWSLSLAAIFLAGYTSYEFRKTNFHVFLLIIFAAPYVLLVHFLRHSYRDKRELISDLSNFELGHASCATEFDRAFILSAIEDWYGSQAAFREFVRGPLREKLLNMIPSPRIPWCHTALLLTSPTSCLLEFSLGLQSSGADGHTMLIFFLSWWPFCICWFWAGYNAIFYLSDKTARYGGNCFNDWMKTLVTCVGTLLWLSVGGGVVVAVARSPSIIAGVCYTFASIIMMLWNLELLKISCISCL